MTPTLYRNPAVEYDYNDWTANHVWLHKPPGALWLMAASMAVFGVNEIAVRLPAVLLSCAAVWLTSLIGRLLLTPGIALLAAGFQVVNGFLVALAAGRRVAEHVDSALIALVELGIWAALRHARDREPWRNVPPSRLPAGVAVAASWTMHTSAMFPREAAAAGRYSLLHVSQTLEGHELRLFAYVAEMPRFFGELVWIPLVAVAVSIRNRPPRAADAPCVGRCGCSWPTPSFSICRRQLKRCSTHRTPHTARCRPTIRSER